MLKNIRVSRNIRVRHATSGFAMKYGDVEKGIAACALAWVVKGISFRNLTEGEAIAARNARAGKMEPLALAEIYGVVFEPPERATAAFRAEMEMAWEARRFAIRSTQPSAVNC